MRIREVVALCAGATLAACGGGGGGDDAPADTQSSAYVAQVASYDLAVESPQRFLVGLLSGDGGLIVGGEVRLDFEPLESSTEAGGSDSAAAVLDVPAAFVSVASAAAPTTGPRSRSGDDAVGVYEASGIQFAQPGSWKVTVRAAIDGEDAQADATFEVLDQHQIVSAGDPAPRTMNLLPDTTEAPPQAVDSRATSDGEFPDPELHELTVADAIASGLPTMVAVTTPTFCVSRFCGPITDSVQVLAQEFAERANFVHIEVWKDFEGNVMNRGAAEWIYPNEGVSPYEPWVFLVDGTGTVIQRWDNVANQSALRDALSAALG